MILEQVQDTAAAEAARPRLKLIRRLLLAAFFVLLVAVVFVGLRIFAGYILGYLAAASLVVALTFRWQRVKSFLVLLAVSVLGTILFSMVYVEVIARVVSAIFGEGAFDSTGWRVFDVVISNLIIFFSPVGILVGIVGSLALYINRITSKAPKRT